MGEVDSGMERDRENELVERSRGGDGEAYGELVRAHQRPLYAFLFRLSRDGETAGEVAQEAFVKAWFALRTFQGGSTFRTWLHRIAINTWHNHLRDRKRHLSLDDVPDPVDGRTGNVVEGIIEHQERSRLDEAIGQLPPRQREALMLRVNEGYPFEEVARIMGCTVGAAKASFHQAVVKLKAAMEERS